MTTAVTLETPLAGALTTAIQPKLEEYGWATGGADDVALSEYIVLMLANNKKQDEVAQELSTDLLGLDANDPGLRGFCDWLFATVDALAAQFATSDASNEAARNAAQGAFDTDHDMDITTSDSLPEINAYVLSSSSPAPQSSSGLTVNSPTGPKAMRNSSDRGGRGQRIMGQINRAMDRTHESALHRTRGNAGINTHSRAPPTGPRAGNNRLSRGGQARATSIQHGLANMNVPPQGMNGGMGAMPAQWGGMMPGQPPLMDLLQQQQQMLQMLSQQVMAQNGMNGGRNNGQGRGRGSLMDRSNRGNGRGRGGHHQNGQHQNGHHAQSSDSAMPESQSGDTEATPREAPKPEETVCRFNLACTNSGCKFAHQSPAAPPGVSIDVNDACSFGIACKNYKCTGRHPSPATKVAHQSEQDCKFFPNCQNPRCPFRHPSKPPCRNGADCKVEGCEFYHTTVMCKFNPCTNRYCTFKHAEGQRGTFPDKVWTADGSQHTSERKFADENAVEEQVIPGSGGDDAMGGTEQTTVAG